MDKKTKARAARSGDGHEDDDDGNAVAVEHADKSEDESEDEHAPQHELEHEHRSAAAEAGDVKKSSTSLRIEEDAHHEEASPDGKSNARPTAELSPISGSRILAPDDMHHREQPYFYYQNATGTGRSHPHFFSLHSHPKHNEEGTLYSNYGTTLTIIIALHLIYFFQWNARRSRQDVSTSYDQLVDKKQYYTAVVAIASHPPVDGGERDTLGNLNSSLGETSNDASSAESAVARSGRFSRILVCRLLIRLGTLLQRIRPIYNRIQQRILHPLVYGSLSGLPLLTFASHILWQCRALEELYDDHDGKLILGVTGNDVNVTQLSGIGTAATRIRTAGDVYNVSKHLSSSNGEFTYFRVLVALAFTSLLMELSLLRSILKRLERHVNFDGYRTTPTQLLSQRAICSVASLSTALLGVYDSHFPYAPPPVLPFVRVSYLSSSGFSLIFTIMILTILTHRIHPVTSIMSGLLSGSLWSLGVTSFLGTKYWGNALLFCLALAVILSLKAQPTGSKYLEVLVPCIDYVSWDSDGVIPDGSSASSQNLFRRTSSRGIVSRSNSSGGDVEMGSTHNGGHFNEERFPLLSSQSSSMSSSGNSGAIRGRVPLINTMESDLDGAEDLVMRNEESVPAASSRFGANLSRRAGVAGN